MKKCTENVIENTEDSIIGDRVDAYTRKMVESVQTGVFCKQSWT